MQGDTFGGRWNWRTAQQIFYLAVSSMPRRIQGKDTLSRLNSPPLYSGNPWSLDGSFERNDTAVQHGVWNLDS
jgi:hypothetical protein